MGSIPTAILYLVLLKKPQLDWWMTKSTDSRWFDWPTIGQSWPKWLLTKNGPIPVPRLEKRLVQSLTSSIGRSGQGFKTLLTSILVNCNLGPLNSKHGTQFFQYHNVGNPNIYSFRKPI